MKNYNPTNYPDYMYGMDCTKPHGEQSQRTHDGRTYQCSCGQKRAGGTIDLTGKGRPDLGYSK